jgi:hypothetical protein
MRVSAFLLLPEGFRHAAQARTRRLRQQKRAEYVETSLELY